MKEGLTVEERRQVVTEAIRLIKRPESFVQGHWKCPLWFHREEPNVLIPEGDDYIARRRGLIQVKDENDRPVFSYCIEGAINQAGINVLGLDRARHFGAYAGQSKWGEPQPYDSAEFSEYLSVNEVARIMFADFLRSRDPEGDERGCHAPARVVNDDIGPKEKAHKSVMRILKERLRTITA